MDLKSLRPGIYFSENEMVPVRERLDAFDANRHAAMTKGQEGISIPGEIVFTAILPAQDKTLDAFIRDPKFVELTSDILGPDVQLYWNRTVYKRPEAKRDFPWHQDNGYVPTDPEHYLTCWVALTDASIKNGCIWVLPGSHRQGVAPHKNTKFGLQCYFGDDPGVPAPVPAGSLIAFQSMLFHRSGPNQSTGMRKAYSVHRLVLDRGHEKSSYG